MKYRLPLHPSVVAIEKGASTKITNFTYFYIGGARGVMKIFIYIYIYIYIYIHIYIFCRILLSTLHHNIFTYLDYDFSATFILSDFNAYLGSYCSSGKTNTKYNLTRHLTWMIPNALYIWKLTCRCVFLNKREVWPRFFVKSNIFKYFSTYQTRSYDFWIMNAMCTFLYLFVVYFSFAPVISASIHRYGNYFDIQVLMMFTETETLTITLHHNIITYLDYVFSTTPIYIYIYIYAVCVHVCVNMKERVINNAFYRQIYGKKQSIYT